MRRAVFFLTLLTLAWSKSLATAQQAPALEFVLQSGHTGAVTASGLSDDGKYLVTAAGESPALLWEVATAKILRTFPGRTMAMSRDGKYLLTADGTASILWDTSSGRKTQTFPTPIGTYATEMRCAALTPDGKRLVTGHWDWDRTIAVWDTASGKKIQTIKRGPEFLSSLALSADGKIVLAATHDGLANVWDAVSGDFLRSINFRPPVVVPLQPIHAENVQEQKVAPLNNERHAYVWALSADGQRVLIGSTNGTASVMPVAPGKPAVSLVGHTGMVQGIAESADGKHIVTGAAGARLFVDAPADNTAILWDAASGKKLKTFTVSDGVASVHLSSDGKHLVTGAARQAILWDIASGKKVRAFQGHAPRIERMVASRDGKRIVTTANDGKATLLWDSSGPKQIDVGAIPSYPGPVLSGDGKFLLAAPAGRATLWETAASEKLRTFNEPAETFALSDDGKIVVTHAPDGTVTHVWDAVNGKKIQSIKHEGVGSPGFLTRVNYGTSISLSADGRFLVAGSADGKTATLWDAASSKKLQTFTVFDKEIRGVALSEDGKLVFTRTMLFEATTLIAWDAATGKRVFTFNVTPGAAISNLSDDGKHVVIVERDGMTISVWDTASGKKIQTLYPSTGQIVHAAMNRDGNLWTLSQDGAIRLWDPSGKERCRFHSFDGKDWLVVTPEGHFDGSPGAWRFVAYREPGALKLVDDDATRKRFHRPGLLAKLWQGKHEWTAAGEDKKAGRSLLADDGQAGTIQRVELSADGAAVMTDGADQTIRLWDAKTGKLRQRFESVGRLLGLAPDGKSFLTTASYIGVGDGLVLWDIATAKEIRRFKLTASEDDMKRGGRPGSPDSGVFSSDGKTLTIGSELNLNYHFFDVAAGKELRRVTWCPGGLGMSSSPTPCRWSPDGKHFAGRYARQPLEFVVALWDTTKAEPQILSEVGEHLYDLAFSADGDYFAWSDTKQTHLWDVRANRKLKTLQGTGYLAFSPDGKYLVVGKTLHPLNGKLPTLQLPVEPRCPAFSRDGQTLLVLAPENNVQAFDVKQLEAAK